MAIDSIYDRRSIRKFQEKDVPVELLNKILDAGRVAPSAKNRQPWKYIVFGNGSKEELLKAMEEGLKWNNGNTKVWIWYSRCQEYFKHYERSTNYNCSIEYKCEVSILAD